jgi:hypothetical protein
LDAMSPVFVDAALQLTVGAGEFGGVRVRVVGAGVVGG